MRVTYSFVSLFSLLLFAGCVRTSVMPFFGRHISNNHISGSRMRRSWSAENRYGRRSYCDNSEWFRKFDHFGCTSAGQCWVIGYTPVTATTYNNGYTSNTTVYGGAPIIAGTHDQAIVVRMFHAADPDAGNAIQARSLLGPDWAQRVAKVFLILALELTTFQTAGDLSIYAAVAR